jgi:hypothetical protein
MLKKLKARWLKYKTHRLLRKLGWKPDIPALEFAYCKKFDSITHKTNRTEEALRIEALYTHNVVMMPAGGKMACMLEKKAVASPAPNVCIIKTEGALDGTTRGEHAMHADAVDIMQQERARIDQLKYGKGQP